MHCLDSQTSNIYQQLFLMIIRDSWSMKELFFGVGTFTNTISLFSTQGQICYNE